MSKGKIFLIAGIIVATISFSAVLVIIASKSTPTTSTQESSDQLLGAQTQTTDETKKELPKLEIIKSPVMIALPGIEYKKAAGGEEITVGSKIITDKGARAQIVYPNKSVTRIDENSEITVAKLEANNNFAVSISLEAGRVWSRVAKLLGAQSYETKSTQTIAAIRGTSYGHATDKTKGQDTIISLRKNVLTRCLNKSQEATVPENSKGVFNCQPTKKALVQELNSKDILDEWLKFNKLEDERLDKKYGIQTYSDSPTGVLGATPTASPTTPAAPSPVPSISIVSSSDVCTPTLSALICYTNVKVTGSNFGTNSDFDLTFYQDGITYKGTLVSSTSTNIEMNFNNLPCGNFSVRVHSLGVPDVAFDATLGLPERKNCG